MVFENKMLKESPVTQSLDLSVSESGQPAGITSVRFHNSVIILVNKTTITTITTITSITTIIATSPQLNGPPTVPIAIYRLLSHGKPGTEPKPFSAGHHHLYMWMEVLAIIKNNRG